MVVTGQHPKETIGGSELQAYWIAQGIHRLGIPTLFCTWHSDRPGQRTEEDGLIHLAIDKRRGLLRRAVNFSKFVRSYRPQVVYVRCFYAIWWVKLLGRFYKYRVVYHASSITQCMYLLPQKWKEGPRSWLRHAIHDLRVYSSGFADEFICQTNDQARLILKTLRKRASVVPNGHPLPESVPQKSLTPRRAVWIGKHWKNPRVFLELAEALSDMKDLEFYMIGVFPGDTAKPYREAADRLPNFFFLGELSRDDLARRLESSHLLVNTSDYEGFSNTFIEAWLHGLAVVSLTVNPDNILTSQKVGLVSGSVKQMAADIIILLADGGLKLRSYARNAVAYARSHHDIKNTASELLRICHKTAEPSCRAGGSTR
jgi:glycosyltransferase involved in cell wall biosynthesis